MSNDRKRRSVLVQMETPNLIPERDLGRKPVLEAHDLGIDFGGLTAVDDFNIAMGRTEISGLIGPNGAGKTTIFNLLTNVYKPTRGTILLDGYDRGQERVEVNKMGIARTFQNIRLFDKMTVEENVLVGLGNSMSTSCSPMCSVCPSTGSRRPSSMIALDLLASLTCRDLRPPRPATFPMAPEAFEIIRALATQPQGPPP